MTQRAYVVAMATLVIAYPFLPDTAQRWSYLAMSVAVVGAVCWGLRTHRPSVRMPWVLLAIGLSCSLAGDIATEIYELDGSEVPAPSFVDGLYLLFYPLLFAVVGSFLAAVGRRDRTAWVDASIWTIGIATLLWEPLL